MGIFESIEAVVAYAQETGLSLAEIMIEQEMRINRTLGKPFSTTDALLAMENAYQRGLRASSHQLRQRAAMPSRCASTARQATLQVK